MFSHLVKVADNLIKQPEALQTLLVNVVLVVELLIVGDGGEHHSDVLITLVIELLEDGGGREEIQLRRPRKIHFSPRRL